MGTYKMNETYTAHYTISQIIDVKEDLFFQFNSKRIKVDVASLGKALKHFIILGSQANMLQASDVIIHLPPAKDIGEDCDLLSLLNNGTSLFAALIYCSTSDRCDFEYQSPTDPLANWNAVTVAQYVFTAYFYIMTQNQALAQVPNDAQFITHTICPGKAPAEMDKALFEAGMKKIDHGWVRAVQIPELSKEARHRLALGICGYRAIQAFFIVKPKPDTPPGYLNVWKTCRESCQRGMFYEFHTHFRPDSFIDTFKSLNKTLIYTLLTHGTVDSVASAKNNKV